MVNNMIEFYKGHLTTYGLVFKYFKRQYRICRFVFFLGLFGALFIFPLVGFKLYGWAIFLSLIVLSTSSYAFYGINVNSKKVLGSRYKIFVKDFIWRVEPFEIMRTEIIMEYLCTQQLFNSNNIKLIIDLLEKESERRKAPTFIKPGIMLAFLAPVWIQFIVVLYKYASDPTSAFTLMAIVFILVFVLFYFGGMAGSVFTEIRDTLCSNDSILIKEFIVLLEDCLLRYPDYLTD